MVSKNFSRWHSEIIFFSLENTFWHFVQIVSNGDNLHEISNPVFWKNITNLLSVECFHNMLSANPSLYTVYPLKHQENLHLKMSSVYVVCWTFLQTFQTYFCKQANCVDPDQTAPKGAIWSGSTLVCRNDFLSNRQKTKQMKIVVTGALRVKHTKHHKQMSAYWEGILWKKWTVMTRSGCRDQISLCIHIVWLGTLFFTDTIAGSWSIHCLQQMP